MLKVAIVGHSQCPVDLAVPGCQVRVFREPGGRADAFRSDPRLYEVLEWQHDLCLLWIGSNDIAEDTEVNVLTQHIREIKEVIEESCDSIVRVVAVEPRQYVGECPISATRYGSVMRAVNRKLAKSLPHKLIQFNKQWYIDNLAHDGVHFNVAGKQAIVDTFCEVIQDFLAAEESPGESGKASSHP